MKHVSVIAIASVAVVCALLTSPVEAQHFTLDQRTNITFSAPVELPGVTLPAGTYVFKFANPLNGKNVLQVLSKDEKQVMGQFFFAEAKRNTLNDQSIVTFKEAREGTAPAVQYWFYPNDIYGVEFMYSKAQAEQIAARAHTPVLSEDGRIEASGQVAQPASSTTADNSAAAAAAPGTPGTRASSPESTVARNEPQASPNATSADRVQNTAPSDRAAQREADSRADADNRDARTARASDDPAATSQRTPAVGTTGSNTPAASDAAATTPTTTAQAELPRTASNLPLAGLIGLLALFGVVGLRTVAHARR